MKNYSITICNKEKRQLSAKGYKFLSQIIEIVANKNGVTRYHSEFKPLKNNIYELIHYLLIDEEKSIDEVKEIIKNRIEKNTLT